MLHGKRILAAANECPLTGVGRRYAHLLLPVQMALRFLPLRLMTLAGAEQPFYHVLVDNRDRPGDESTYVAEENIRVLPCVVRMHPIVLTFLSTAAPAAAG